MKRDIFRQTIVSKFQFLETDYGFSVMRKPTIDIDPDAEAVVFERSETQVIANCSIQDGWGLEVLLENPAFGQFSFHTYLKLVDIQTARMLGYGLATTDDELFALADIYSQALKKFGAGLLSKMNESGAVAARRRTGRGDS